MCLILLAPAGARYDVVALRQAATENPHGYGIAYARGGSLHVRHTMSADVWIAACQAAPVDSVRLAHARWRSAGPMTEAQCHPFVPDDRWCLAHNGHLAATPEALSASDTQAYARLFGRIPDLPSVLAGDPVARWAWDSIWTGQRVVVLGADGQYVITGEALGEWRDGVWRSKPVLSDTLFILDDDEVVRIRRRERRTGWFDLFARAPAKMKKRKK